MFGDDDDFSAEELAALDAMEAVAVEAAAAAASKRSPDDQGRAVQDLPPTKRPAVGLGQLGQSTTTPAGTLQRYFGFDEFRPRQGEVVDAVLAKRDAAVFWSTGSGKRCPLG